MGLIARLLNFNRVTRNDDIKLSEAGVDPGGGANITCEHFSSPGDDSHPLPDDTVILVRVPRSGGHAAVGYIDTVNEGVAEPGEKRVYGRNSDGEIVNEVHLKADGSISIGESVNGENYIEITPDGDISIVVGAANKFVNLHGVSPGDFVARASLVDNELALIKIDLDNVKTGHDNHLHPGSVDSLAGPVTIGPALPQITPPHSPQEVGSEKVKTD